jgi:mono/diheme cytochrome c family protein
MRRPARWALVSSLAALLVLAAGIALRRWAHGFSARDEPPALEKRLARRLRRLATPAEVRRRTNPVPLSPEVLSEARAHFADHCASCHGNDGRGKTEIGQRLYPRAPDMTLTDTQSMTDGEIFQVVKYGVRLTGMPAWGSETSKDDDLATWKLVHFIRHLPEVTKTELDEMEKLNPRSPGEPMTEQEEEKFLEGGEAPAATAPSHSKQH